MIFNPAPMDLSGEHLATSANSEIGTSVAEHLAVLGAHVFTTGLGDCFHDRCENEHGINVLVPLYQSQYITTQLFRVDGGDVLR